MQYICPICGSVTKDNYCPNCSNKIRVLGEIDLKDVLKRSIQVIRKKPILLLPQFLYSIFLVIVIYNFHIEFFDYANIISFIASNLTSIFLLIFLGTLLYSFNSIVAKSYNESSTINLKESWKEFINCLPKISLLSLIIFAITSLSLTLFIIPGLILLFLLIYSIPALVTDSLKTSEVMVASWRFAKKNFAQTAAIMGIFFILWIISGPFPYFGIMLGCAIMQLAFSHGYYIYTKKY